MKERNKYTIYGALFGALFPVIAFLVITFISQNITVLFAIICSAPFFLGIFARFAGIKQDGLNEINKNLENLVQDRTAEIQNLMDVSGQGFLSFGSDYKVKPEYSRECERIFGGPIGGVLIHTLLFEDEKKQNEFIDGMDLIFNDKAKAAVVFDLMEREFEIGIRTIRVEYRAHSRERILCTLTDISAEKELENIMKEEKWKERILFSVISHKKYFYAFVQEAADLFDLASFITSGEERKDQLEKLQRKLHTFKGNASFFKFEKTNACAHDLEYYISDRLVLGEEISIKEQLIILKRLYYSELQIVKDTLGEEWIRTADSVLIPRGQFMKLERYIRKYHGDDLKLCAALNSYRRIPFKDMFVRFPEMADKLALSVGKSIKPLEIYGGEFPVDPEKYDDLINSCVHLLRNMVDHGIESPPNRELKKKNSQGSLAIRLDKVDHSAVMEFSDDGKGISIHQVRQKGIEKGIIGESESNKHTHIDLLFRQGFSTADTISEISGRGVGLAVVREKVKALNGKIQVSTKVDQGTTFKIIVPL